MLIVMDDIDAAIGDEVIYRVHPKEATRKGIIARTYWLAGAEFFEIHEIYMSTRKPTGDVHKIPGAQIDYVLTDDPVKAYDRAMRGV